MNRNLDGVYFRVKRNGKFENVCFSDLSDSEMDSIMNDRDEQWLKSLCKVLGQTIHRIGDELDITGE
jgi:hypothetical protein